MTGPDRGPCSSARWAPARPRSPSLLADAWGVDVRDTDADVEAAEGRSIADIFVDDGEAHFRALEAKAVAEALATHAGVLALGGGAVLDPATRELLAGHRVVFLRVGLSDAVKRVGLGTVAAAAARQRPRPDQGAARRAHPGLRVGRHADGRHRRAEPRGRRRARSRRRSHERTAPCCRSPAPRRTTWWSGTASSADVVGLLGDRRSSGSR